MTNGSYRQTLSRKGLQPFLWTQFLGAFNDNLFQDRRVAARGPSATRGGGDRELSIISAIFILPFLLFSGYAARWPMSTANARSSSSPSSLEIVAASLGLVAFLARTPRDHLCGALPDRAAGDVLQPREIRNTAGGAPRSRPVRAPTVSSK